MFPAFLYSRQEHIQMAVDIAPDICDPLSQRGLAL